MENGIGTLIPKKQEGVTITAILPSPLHEKLLSVSKDTGQSKTYIIIRSLELLFSNYDNGNSN